MKFSTIILSVFVLLQPELKGKTTYVSTGGNDNSPGSIKKTLASFAGAVNKVREIKPREQDIIVLFRGGRYNFTETVILDKDDSGSKNQKITYAAYSREKPIFTSGLKIHE